MPHIEQEVVAKLAKLSSLDLTNDEIEKCASQISVLLDYIESLNEVSVTIGLDSIRTINVFRDDKTIVRDSGPVLKQAPAVEGTHFVVPKVLD